MRSLVTRLSFALFAVAVAAPFASRADDIPAPPIPPGIPAISAPHFYCDLVKDVKIPPPDCRYDLSKAPARWVPPTESEWSRNVDGDRSGFINLYVHGSLDKLMAALENPLLGAEKWIKSAVNNKVDNKAYVHSAAQYLAGLEAKHIYATSPRLRARIKKDLDNPKSLLSKKMRDPDFQAGFATRVKNVEATIEAMPMSDEYFCGKVQVAGYERDNVIWAGRHHFRIFDLNVRDAQGKPVWGIAANHDIKIFFHPDMKLAKRGFLDHMIDNNTDGERDTILKTLFDAGAVKATDPHLVTFSCKPPEDGALSQDSKTVDVYLNE